MTKIRHNLNLDRGNLRIVFEDRLHNRIKGGHFYFLDPNEIELDDTYLAEHPEISFVTIGPADDEDGTKPKFGWARYGRQTTQEAFADLGRAVDEMVQTFKQELVKMLDAIKEKLDGR